ncbi:hypothetical protein WJ038_08325 [Vibrio parahaemolyticus]|uniref:hypothetical protein n=1 Tax=Vibrio parahaemolyticus TaxID=670 RepID=UPI0004A45D2B|nr:hypothetical protein [Vibrio parahaemolyticus]AMG07227.1 hypothetical protein AL464_10705 [Vibrio parahaemolyticus]EGR0429335.1 hypothetical protein [Vibrio parahaemolyticus]EJG0786300.1 hypothetical protein [Vibrio parahaemolyticus]EJG1592825.1 hypothetical protein [Vibrio parahaemolyticus]KKI07052.1 hypothetical protein WU75_22950 [Vibrio parahaemolyticus]
MKKFDLIHPTESNRYSLFTSDLEDDSKILFHATPTENLNSIKNKGFLSSHELYGSGLESVSYAFRSSSCLAHLNGKFDKGYVVFVVRFESLEVKEIVVNPSDIHVYRRFQPTEIIGYCEIPLNFSYT